MISSNPHAQQVATLLLAHNISDVVISPGSRNGALVHTFIGSEEFNCRNVVDERSAGYFALGLAQAISRPVVLLCSSGTATLNYAPAVAEAFHQGIPLIVLTADRPAYWIGQLENQCVNQNSIYQNFSKYSATLPLDISDKSLWFARRQINEAIHHATSGKLGSAHLNIPFEEPLHETINAPLPKSQGIKKVATFSQLTEYESRDFLDIVQRSERILIIVGQHAPDKALRDNVLAFAELTDAVVLAEPLANLGETQTIWQIDNVCKTLGGALGDEARDFRPDLLITCGEQVVSKFLKGFLRTNTPDTHYHISADGAFIDTYQSLSHVVPMRPTDFFADLLKVATFNNTKSRDFLNKWQAKQNKVQSHYNSFVAQSDFADLSVYQQIFSQIPNDSVIHLGNSSSVRYTLMNSPIKGSIYLCNRGTSGIDGSLSTAVGYASNSKKINTVVLGDLSFLYDSNALWNHYLDANLRIIVVNNGGGNIFGLLETLAKKPHFKQHFFAEHDATAEPFAKAFGLDYAYASDEKALHVGLQTLYASDRKKPMLLEVFTNAEKNTEIHQQLQQYLNFE